MSINVNNIYANLEPKQKILNKKPIIEDSSRIDEENNYFKTIFDKNENGICLVDSKGIIKEVNYNYSKMFGYSISELKGKHFRIITTPDSREQIEKNHKKIFNGTSDLITEEKVKRKNGTYFYIQTTNTRVNDENGNGIRITTAIDISSRLRTELVQSVLLKISKLSSSTTTEVELFKTVFKSIAQLMPVNNFAVCIKDKINQKLNFPFILNEFKMNEELFLEKEFNYLESSGNSILLNSYKINSLIDNKYLPEYKNRPHSIVGVPLKIKEELIGSLIIKDFNGAIYTDENKDILELVASYVVSVIERKKYEEQLIVERNKAEESSRLKSEFLAQISHEIRTPLNSILSFSALIKDELKDVISEELAETFDFIERGGVRLTRTIELLLNLSLTKNQQYKIDLTEVDIVTDILNPIIEGLRPNAIKRELELSLKKSDKSLRLVCDSYSVNQLFTNLIDNAIKYTEKGTVLVKPFLNEFGNLQIDVVDTGIGIANEYIPKMFEAFSQEEQGYTRSYEGLGLGLSLVKNYADLNHAELKVKSKKNVGTTFSVIFNL